MKENIAYRIIPADESDIPQILQLVKKLARYEKLSDRVTASVELYRKFGFGDEKYFNALIVESTMKSKTRHMGFALYFYTFSTFTGRPTLYLEDLFVLPEFRGMGIGKALLRKLAAIARDKQCARMEWAVLDWNMPAIDFYKSLGAVSLDDWKTFRLEDSQIERLANES